MEKESSDDLVSIIIPVYNVENYLDKCVDSVILQTYKNIEIILVDDGSKDHSGAICDHWKEKDKRIKVIHKTNGGLSSARNAGIEISSGDYLFFLDSDDYISVHTIEILLKHAKENNADLVETALTHVYKNKNVCRAPKGPIKVLGTEEALIWDLGGKGGAVSSCGKLFKRSIFSNYRFREKKLHEDHFSIVDLLSKANRFVFVPDSFYYYIHRNNSITTYDFSPKSLDDMEAAAYNYKLIASKYPKAIKAAEFRLDFSTLKLIDKLMLSDNPEEYGYLNEWMKHVRSNKRRILKSEYFTKNRKLSFIILLMNRHVYRELLKFHMRRNWSA